MSVRIAYRGRDLMQVPQPYLEPIELLCNALALKQYWDPGARALHIDSPVHGRTVVIDAAHGGDDRFDRGLFGFVEADGVLRIARHLQTLLVGAGAKAILTRKDDQTVSYRQRCALAREAEPDVLIALYTGDSPDASRRGLATFYSWPCPARSRRLARNIAQEMSRITLAPSNGARFRLRTRAIEGHRLLVAGVSRPAVLVRCGSHGTLDEERLLANDAYQQKCAVGIFRGIMRYFQGGRVVPHGDRVTVFSTPVGAFDAANTAGQAAGAAAPVTPEPPPVAGAPAAAAAAASFVPTSPVAGASGAPARSPARGAPVRPKTAALSPGTPRAPSALVPYDPPGGGAAVSFFPQPIPQSFCQRTK